MVFIDGLWIFKCSAEVKYFDNLSSFLSLSLSASVESRVCFIMLQLISSAELSGGTTEVPTTESVACQVCRVIPGLTPSQQEICCDNPTAIVLLDTTEHMMRTECRWQLRKELWNCSEIGMPIFRPPQMPGTDGVVSYGTFQKRYRFSISLCQHPVDSTSKLQPFRTAILSAVPALPFALSKRFAFLFQQQ